MQILRYQEMTKGALKGIFTLKVDKWGLLIHDMRYFESNGRKWISFPQKKSTVNGVEKWFPLMQFEDKRVMGQFTDKALPLLAECAKCAQNERNEAERPCLNIDVNPF